MNRDYISTEIFLRNYDKNYYDSFIFGSSRTLAFKTTEWKKHLSDDSMPFMFDSANENIWGIYEKLKFLNENNVKIKNAIFVFCKDATFVSCKNLDGHLYIKHTKISGESNIVFYYTFLKSWLENIFFVKYIDYYLYSTNREYLNTVIDDREIKYDKNTNDLFLIKSNSSILADENEYYANLNSKNIFYKKTGNNNIQNKVTITDSCKNILRKVKEILEDQKTKYTVILSPIYDVDGFTHANLAILKNIFGDDNVFNFSNTKVLTDNYKNYYERSHYLPKVEAKILSIIYENKKDTIN